MNTKFGGQLIQELIEILSRNDVMRHRPRSSDSQRLSLESLEHGSMRQEIVDYEDDLPSAFPTEA